MGFYIINNITDMGYCLYVIYLIRFSGKLILASLSKKDGNATTTASKLVELNVFKENLSSIFYNIAYEINRV